MATVHAEEPPVGWVEETIVPRPTATHKMLPASVHEIESRLPPESTVSGADQEVVGEVEVTTPPLASMAAQRDGEEHETAVRPASSTSCPTQVALAPAIGLVEVHTWPAVSATTHRVVDGHEIPETLVAPIVSVSKDSRLSSVHFAPVGVWLPPVKTSVKTLALSSPTRHTA